MRVIKILLYHQNKIIMDFTKQELLLIQDAFLGELIKIKNRLLIGTQKKNITFSEMRILELKRDEIHRLWQKIEEHQKSAKTA